MVEALLYFAVPLAPLRASGVDWRKALFVSFFAVVPDLDVPFHMHRSLSHPLVVVIVVRPILAIGHKNEVITDPTLLTAFGVITHVVLNVFGAFTLLIWPLSNQCIQIVTGLDLHVGSVRYFRLS